MKINKNLYFKTIFITILLFAFNSFANNKNVSILLKKSLFLKQATSLTEASAIIELNGSLIVAGDENRQALWLINPSSGNIQSIPFDAKTLKTLPDDIEALAPVSNNRFLISTSQSRTKSGKRKSEREVLALLQFDQKSQMLKAEQEWSLRDILIKHLSSTLSKEVDVTKMSQNTPESGGLNVEGLALIGDILYMGLRSPITDKGESIIIRINLELLMANKESFFESPILLPTGGRGIRSLSEKNDSLIILAGDSSDSSSFSFELYKHKAGATTTITPDGMKKLVRPEGVSISNTSAWLVEDLEAGETRNPLSRITLVETSD